MANAPQSAGPGPLQFGKYWLDAELAVGGMARLFRARLRGPGGFEKKLVVKQILPELAGDPSFIELLVREANTLVQMSHPNIVPIYELGVVDGVYFLAMELVEGATIAELLLDGALPAALGAHVAAQVCDALHYAHERFGLVHRDVTPRNIIVDADGHVKLLDFGIAAPHALTGQGERFGSPGYMSPEQARGDALSARSDLFSLGVVLHEALTDVRPAPGCTGPKVVGGGELSELLETMLAATPERRPNSAAEVAAALRAWLAGHHPQGVAALLGQRVERARSRAAREPGSAPQPVTSHPRGQAGVTRSIATRHELGQVLNAATERLPAAQRSIAAPQPGVRARALGVTAMLVALVLFAAAGFVVWNRSGHAGVPSSSVAARSTTASRDVLPQASDRPGPGPLGSAPPLAPSRDAPAGAAPAAPASGAATAAGELRTTPSAGLDRTATRHDSARVHAYLSVNALPWAEVRLDDHSLGSTPLRSLPTSAGDHVLALSCPPLGRSARVPLQFVAGGRYQVLVDLQQTPPQVSVR